MAFAASVSGDMATAATWSRFFLEAGIPAAAAAQYAVSFVENRISMDMLMELNKVGNSLLLYLHVKGFFPRDGARR